ncbi:alpha/beta hydrolase [Haloprofundus marisrubri]|uniref:Alpha/beta hydrolase n=1 Tax=Haloprofundus marisrubri TaxID=1514971 RepID=A0A0W1R6T8_9EURY|nr:alpha/beta hydrolase [Haloprofundus marisrubri]KTG08929.1 alpha/beta hydrolase [Haloprofundus marisrubri]
MLTHTVRGGDDVSLHVVETGNADGRPIFFVHGYSQSHRSWTRQFNSRLTERYRLVSMDNRGHGQSETPEDGYDRSDLWADDVRAVLDALELDDVVLVGWSYAGLVVLDYLDAYGTDRVAGVNLVSAISKMGTEAATALLDPGYIDLLPRLGSDDAEESVAALEAFLRRCVHAELSTADLQSMLGYNVVVPPRVRRSLRSRTVDHDDVLAALDVPALYVHGEHDAVVDVAAAEGNAERTPNARLSVYEDAGHTPFWESPGRYNRELDTFVSGL